MRRSSTDVFAVLCLLLAIVCWGVPPIMLRYLAGPGRVADGFTTNLVRYPVSTIVYIPIMIAAHRRGLRLGSFWKWAILPAAVNVVGQTMFAIAPYLMPAGLMSFLLRLSTIWSVLLALVLFRDERMLARSVRFWTAAVLSMVGFLLMAIIGNKDMTVSVGAIVMIFMCSIFWGLYDVTVRMTMGKLPPLVVFGVIGNYTSIGLVALGPIGEPSSLANLSWPLWLLLIVSAYIGIGAAHGAYYFALQRLGVAISSITLLLSPFVTIIGSALILHEEFTWVQWVGGVVLIVGAALALWTRFAQRRVPLEEEAIAVHD